MTIRSKEFPFHMQESKFNHLIGPYRSSLKQFAGETFVMVEPSIENVNATISSYDNASYGDFRDKFYRYGLQYMESEYVTIFANCVGTTEEISEWTDWSKSGGYTATYHHIQSKGDLIKDQAYLESEHHLTPWNTIPYISVANKKELKLKEDVMKMKIRHFYIAEYHLFRSQIKFGKKSSLRLKKFKWSAYGFSPFNGGVHQLALLLESKPVRFFYDVSGWDKFIPCMSDLYDIISKHTPISDQDLDEFSWMVQHTVKFYCVLYDGDVIFKDYGNASGSGTTTRDNILMHVILAASFLSEAYFLRVGELPSFQLLSQQVVRLFGDDSVFSVDVEFDYVLHNMDSDDGFLNQFFKRLGMKLKFLYGGLNFPVSKMSFLGYTFSQRDGYYLPLYDPVRLATSFLHVNDRQDTLQAFCTKIFTLTMMSFASDKFDEFFNAYCHVISELEKVEQSDPVVQSFMLARLTPSLLFGFYTGVESNLGDFTFFESLLSLGFKGLKSLDCSYSKYLHSLSYSSWFRPGKISLSEKKKD